MVLAEGVGAAAKLAEQQCDAAVMLVLRLGVAGGPGRGVLGSLQAGDGCRAMFGLAWKQHARLLQRAGAVLFDGAAACCWQAGRQHQHLQRVVMAGCWRTCVGVCGFAASGAVCLSAVDMRGSSTAFAMPTVH
jgi:hypothetical protein